jgi:putative DNA primase/helicase
MSEAILLRRKQLWANGFRPVALDREGRPLGAAWLQEAQQDPPRATLTAVDINAEFTGILLGETGDEGDALVAVGLDINLISGGPGLEDGAVFSAVIAELDQTIGATPLCRRRPGKLAFLYRSRRSPAWDWVDVQSSGVFMSDGDARWRDRQPEDVRFEELPFLDEESWVKAIAAGVGTVNDAELDEETETEEVPELEPDETGFGPPDEPPGDDPPRALPPYPPDGPPPIEPPEGPPGPLPRIVVKSGLRHIAADRGLEALYSAGVQVFNRDGQMVRVEKAPMKDSKGSILMVPAIRPVLLPSLGRLLGQTALWFRLTPERIPFRVDPPLPVVQMIFAMSDAWKFPPLAGITRTVTLRPDWSILDKPGYDSATGLFGAFDANLRVPRIPTKPTRRQAEDAVGLLMRAIETFPFVSLRDAATAVAALLTAMIRPAIEVSPMFLVNAPASGTGKSYLMDCISGVATGDRCPVIAQAPKEEETEKRLVGAALLGNSIILLDNIRRMLEGDFLCQVTERPLLQLRPLGKSDVRQVRNTFVMYGTGNNAASAGDMTRRLLQIAMDANCERPELRDFDGEPFREILAHRGDFISACLTIPRYYIGAGCPNLRRRMASYEQFSDFVRSPLCHLGLPDPLETQRALLADDPVATHRRSIFVLWHEALARQLVPMDERGLRVRELIELANADGNRDLLEALLEIAEGQHQYAGKIDHGRLGRYLSASEDTVAGGLKLLCDRSDASRPRWRLVPSIPAADG